MTRLAKFYVGRWEYTETYSNGAKNTGVYTSEAGPGGFSIINRFHSKGPVGDFEGVIVMTWDPTERAYKGYVFGDSSAGAMVQTGQWEGETLVYRGELTMGTNKATIRSAASLSSTGMLVSDQFTSVNGGPERRLVHVEAVRK